MPVLTRKAPAEGRIALRPASSALRPAGESLPGKPAPGLPGARLGFLESCSNPGCRSGWLHLWRKRSVPVFEQGWTCSPECTGARVEAAVQREQDGTEEGKYFQLTISSYLPMNGVDGFVYTPNPQRGSLYSTGNGVFDFKRTTRHSVIEIQRLNMQLIQTIT